jgi:DNA-binding response OmpR family regulator
VNLPQQIPCDNQRTIRVLIVEDEPMIALSLEDVLTDAGFEIAGLVTKLEKALAVIESGACDAAIVDANLAGVSASPLAIALTARGLPFIVLSGYSREQMQDVFSGARFLQKPCRAELLIETLNTVLLKRQSH